MLPTISLKKSSRPKSAFAAAAHLHEDNEVSETLINLLLAQLNVRYVELIESENARQSSLSGCEYSWIADPHPYEKSKMAPTEKLEMESISKNLTVKQCQAALQAFCDRGDKVDTKEQLIAVFKDVVAEVTVDLRDSTTNRTVFSPRGEPGPSMSQWMQGILAGEGGKRAAAVAPDTGDFVDLCAQKSRTPSPLPESLRPTSNPWAAFTVPDRSPRRENLRRRSTHEDMEENSV